jgi:hypothetical protein
LSEKNPNWQYLSSAGPISSTGICPEVEKEACPVLEGTAEVAMLAQIELRIEDPREEGDFEHVLHFLWCVTQRKKPKSISFLNGS